MEVLRNAGGEERCHLSPELGAKQAEKVRLCNENYALHPCRQPTFFEELGELVRKVHRGALVTRIPSIGRVASLSMAVEISLRARFEIMVLDATRGVVDTLEDAELLSLVLE